MLGIPGYYRQFGYEYALHAEGGRQTSIHTFPRWGDKEDRKFRLREPTVDDVPFITKILNKSANRSLVSPVFRKDEVRYLTFDRTERSAVCHRTAILCRSEGGVFSEPVGVMMYAMVTPIDLGVILRLEMSEPRYWREALNSALCEFVELADEASNQDPDPERAIKSVRLDMQPDHPAFIFDDGALGQPPERQYGWYVRVPDIATFLRKISSALEKRLGESLQAGFTGDLVLRFDRDTVNIAFEDGRITDVVTHSAAYSNAASSGWHTATARFPGTSFLPVLFGMRSVGETLLAHTDANAGSKSDRHLIETLFPKRSSDLMLTLT